MRTHSMGKIETLTLTEVLDVLSDWNIRHRWRIPDERGLLDGCANPNTRTIELCDNAFRAERVYTLTHELIHASDMQRGYNSGEKETERRTNETYKKIYGHRFMR